MCKLFIILGLVILIDTGLTLECSNCTVPREYWLIQVNGKYIYEDPLLDSARYCGEKYRSILETDLGYNWNATLLLAQQYIVTTLNQKRGACISSILLEDLEISFRMLESGCQSGVGFTGLEREAALSIGQYLQSYNEGRLDVPVCRLHIPIPIVSYSIPNETQGNPPKDSRNEKVLYYFFIALGSVVVLSGSAATLMLVLI